jgi:hypothetical protein
MNTSRVAEREKRPQNSKHPSTVLRFFSYHISKISNDVRLRPQPSRRIHREDPEAGELQGERRSSFYILNRDAYRELFAEMSGLKWLTELDNTEYEIYSLK